MTEVKSPGTNRARLIAIAAVVGALIGIAAVYVTRSGESNGSADAACADAPARAEKLDPLAKGEVAAFRPATTPVSLTGLEFTGSNGEPLTVGSFAGKTVLLNLWATWCVPCRKEMPALDRLDGAMSGDRFALIALNTEIGDPARAKRFLSEIGVAHLDWYADPKLSVFNELKRRRFLLGLPTTLLIGPDGCQLGIVAGPAEWDSPDAHRLIEAALGGS